MAISVFFRGPSLFVLGTGVINEVLLPDGKRTIFNGGVKDKHPDNSNAKKHHAGLLVLTADGGIALRKSLYRKRVTVRDPSDAGACTTETSFAKVVPLSALTNGPDASKHLKLLSPGPDYWTRVAAAVHLEGGTIGSEEDSDLVFEFPKTHNPSAPGPQQIPLIARWTPTGTEAEIVVESVNDDDTELTIPLADGQVAWIYNFDSKEPFPADMGKPKKPCKKPGRLEDHDFKWLYQLLDPPGGDWQKWLEKQPLPAPLSECPVVIKSDTAAAGTDAVAGASTAPSPDVASCFFGSWP
jgi:hypothetical protein